MHSPPSISVIWVTCTKNVRQGERFTFNIHKIHYRPKIAYERDATSFRQRISTLLDRKILTVGETIKTNFHANKIVDYNGDVIQGSFYDHEFQKGVKSNDAYKIDKSIRGRYRDGRVDIEMVESNS